MIPFSKSLSIRIKLIAALIGCVLMSVPAVAYETDQYTVPPKPLYDIGPEFSEFITQALIETKNEFSNKPNTNPAEFIKNFRTRFSGSITWQEQRDGVFGVSLTLFPIATSEEYIFDPGKTQNIYSFAGFHRLISPTYFVFSSSVRAYDVYFGVDKLGHFFNQGFQYWERYQELIKQGLHPAVAERRVVAWGQKTENGLFGKIVDGVYSNADLAANYAGFKFYQNLFEPIYIGDQVKTAILKADLMTDSAQLLRPFISHHFNESLNPSVLESPMRAVVKIAIRNRCQAWRGFYKNPSKEQVLSTEQDLVRWYGASYGNHTADRLLLSDLCY